ncbi:hypothetical protein MCC01946_14000 [Bifidobacteriaceae bacterium MCC01946]|nr:hypothetical protein MCC01946_14000 [Bifidobacteriaceae bacterium MCC01946]
MTFPAGKLVSALRLYDTMKTIPPSTFPQYSNGSAPLLHTVARINGGYNTSRLSPFARETGRQKGVIPSRSPWD